MKVLHRDGKIVGTAGDNYIGPDSYVSTTAEIVAENLHYYSVVDGQLVYQFDKMISAGVQSRLDQFAQTRGYDSIHTLASYAGDDDSTYNAEGTYGKMIRGSTWRKVTQIQSDIASGNWPTPNANQTPSSFAEIEDDLPMLQWP